jgi:transmembrane sensor
MEKKNGHINFDLLTRFLADEVSPEERVQVLDWKGSLPENEKVFKELQDVWAAMDKASLQDEIDINAEWNHLEELLNKKSIVKSRKISVSFFIRTAAAIFISFGIFYFGQKFLSEKSVRTKNTETSEVILPDGSRVTLNAGSKLTYQQNFGKEKRIVSLVGEAFFEVKKNPGWPFIIQLGEAEIKVLGTSFNVKAYKNADKIEVTVAEGMVSLYEKNREEKKVIARKGERAVYSKELKAVKKQMNEDTNYISWKTKYIVFNNETLINIASTLSNVYHKSIVIQNSALYNCKVTTNFDNKDLNTVLNVLKSTLDIRIEETDKEIIISGEGC